MPIRRSGPDDAAMLLPLVDDAWPWSVAWPARATTIVFDKLEPTP